MCKTIIQTIFYGCILLLLSLNHAAAIPASAKLPIITIDATQSPPLPALDQGLNTGRKVKALFPDLEQRYDQFLATRFSQAHFDQLQQKNLPLLLQQMLPADRQELNGLAAAFRLVHHNELGDGLLSHDEYHLLNLLADLGFAPYGSGIGVFGQATGNNGVLVGRNVDWKSNPELRSLQLITRYHYPQRTVVTIGFAGMLATFNGFNNQGLFLGYFNAEPYSAYHKRLIIDNTMHLSGFAIRHALTTYTTLRQASKQLGQHRYSVNNSLLIADKENVQVLEYQRGKIAQQRTWQSKTKANKPWQKRQQIAIINCLVLAQLPNTCRGSANTYRWQRLYQRMRFDATHPATITTLSALLLDRANKRYELFNQYTVQSLVFSPTHNSLYLYTAPPLAQAAPSQPQHQAYLDLIPYQQRIAKPPLFTLLQAMWLVLLLLFMATFWLLLKKPRLASLQSGVNQCMAWCLARGAGFWGTKGKDLR